MLVSQIYIAQCTFAGWMNWKSLDNNRYCYHFVCRGYQLPLISSFNLVFDVAINWIPNNMVSSHCVCWHPYELILCLWAGPKVIVDSVTGKQCLLWKNGREAYFTFCQFLEGAWFPFNCGLYWRGFKKAQGVLHPNTRSSLETPSWPTLFFNFRRKVPLLGWWQER